MRPCNSVRVFLPSYMAEGEGLGSYSAAQGLCGCQTVLWYDGFSTTSTPSVVLLLTNGSNATLQMAKNRMPSRSATFHGGIFTKSPVMANGAPTISEAWNQRIEQVCDVSHPSVCKLIIWLKAKVRPTLRHAARSETSLQACQMCVHSATVSSSSIMCGKLDGLFL